METPENFNSALKVNDGIPQPPDISIDAVERFKRLQKQAVSVDDYVHGIIKGDRIMLSKAITLIESSLHSHYLQAQKIIEGCLPAAGRSIRIGITGVPGVGKSTFIEALGKYATSIGHKVAVLAIDPSSNITKGSILGDKTRMEDLSVDPNAFIRPSPSAGTLGGVARKTRESIIVCEAAGFDVIIVETVGVGQSEVAVHSMVDFFLLLMLSGAGDELQGIKRGIMEMADAIAINKADGDNIMKAQTARSQYANALHMFPPKESKWTPTVETCSAISHTGVDKIWHIIQNYQMCSKENGYFETHRTHQTEYLMMDTIHQELEDHFNQNEEVKASINIVKEDLFQNKISAYIAAQKLLEIYFSRK